MVETIISMVALSVIAIMESYYFIPWQAIKQKTFINKIPVISSILNCAVCFTFWSSLAYFSFLSPVALLLAFKYALINTIITVYLQDKFILY